MNKETLIKKLREINQWIFDNHEHHSGCEGFDLLENKKTEDTALCIKGNYPYVNSLKLEKKINNLIKEIENENN